jgi:hypothetical protein
MGPNARYTGTLQLKQLAERCLVEYGTSPDQAAAWSAIVDYFEDQLQQVRPQVDPSIDTDPEPGRPTCHEFNQLLHA